MNIGSIGRKLVEAIGEMVLGGGVEARVKIHTRLRPRRCHSERGTTIGNHFDPETRLG